jgi:hypothetical protein
MIGKVAALALGSVAVGAAYWSADYLFGLLGERTHQRLTLLVRSDTRWQLPEETYPDIHKFLWQILVDAGNQEDAHKSPDGSKLYWHNNEDLWDTQLRLDHYPQGLYENAYTDLGYIVHLVQDSTVPAHDRVIWHGMDYHYALDPSGPQLYDPDYGWFGRMDDFENAATGVPNELLYSFPLVSRQSRKFRFQTNNRSGCLL